MNSFWFCTFNCNLKLSSLKLILKQFSFHKNLKLNETKKKNCEMKIFNSNKIIKIEN